MTKFDYLKLKWNLMLPPQNTAGPKLKQKASSTSLPSLLRAKRKFPLISMKAKPVHPPAPNPQKCPRSPCPGIFRGGAWQKFPTKYLPFRKFYIFLPSYNKCKKCKIKSTITNSQHCRWSQTFRPWANWGEKQTHRRGKSYNFGPTLRIEIIIAKMGLLTSKEEAKPVPAFTYQNMIKHITNKSIHDDYELLETLGKGSFAEVRKAKSKRSGMVRAVKIVDRVKHAKIEPLLLNEFDILREMDHPNILKIYQIYEEPKFYYIVTEFCAGRELFDILRERKQLSEAETAPIFYQICSAVQYLHSHGVMHRDLKPENVMYDEASNALKLIDFGSALRYENDQMMQKRRVGTSFYIAPEVIDRCYNNKCDLWSLGVVLYVLLSGEAPFKGKNDDEVLQSIISGEYNFIKSTWDSVSSQAKLLITDLLTQNPYSRPSIVQVMKSDWVKKYLGRVQLQQPNKAGLHRALSNMQKFNETKSNNIEGAVLVFIVNFVKNPGDEAELQKCFKELDLNGDGMLSLEQLTIGLEKYLKVGKKQAKAVASTIFKRVDTNNSGYIDYSEFLVAANNMQLAATEQNLGLAFDCIDQDKNGLLSTEELRAKLGDNIPVEAYERMLRENIPGWKGEVSKTNFVAMMKKMINKA